MQTNLWISLTRVTTPGGAPGISDVSLVVYDVLAHERKAAGTHNAIFNAEELASGMYICRQVAGNGFKAFLGRVPGTRLAPRAFSANREGGAGQEVILTFSPPNLILGNRMSTGKEACGGRSASNTGDAEPVPCTT